MGYPVQGYRNSAARTLGSGASFQKAPPPTPPKPWQLPARPANDNIPRPSNDNVANRPGAKFKPSLSGRQLRGVLTFGLDPESVLAKGLLNAMNSMPGWAQPMNREMAQYTNWDGLPLFKLWQNGPSGALGIESSGTASTRQTGQALGNPPYAQTQTIPPGFYADTFRVYKIDPVNWRADELATYGPAPASGAKPRQYTYGLATVGTPYLFPYTLPYGLQPYREPSPFPESWVGGNEAPQPLVSPVSRPPPMVPRAPPGPRVKERKLKAGGTIGAVVRFLSAGSEAADLMDAFYDALPEKYKTSMKGKKKWEQELAKGQQLYQHWDKVDLDSALFNAVWNQAEDMAWGQLGIKTKPLGLHYGQTVGANRLIGGAAGGQLSSLLSKAEAATKATVSSVTGLTLI